MLDYEFHEPECRKSMCLVFAETIPEDQESELLSYLRLQTRSELQIDDRNSARTQATFFSRLLEIRRADEYSSRDLVGPGGLTLAQILRHNGRFEVTVFKRGSLEADGNSLDCSFSSDIAFVFCCSKAMDCILQSCHALGAYSREEFRKH